jgi:hypothetical protein
MDTVLSGLAATQRCAVSAHLDFAETCVLKSAQVVTRANRRWPIADGKKPKGKERIAHGKELIMPLEFSVS